MKHDDRESRHLEGLAAMTLKELREIAREASLRGRSTMKKQQLIEALSKLPGVGSFVAKWRGLNVGPRAVATANARAGARPAANQSEVPCTAGPATRCTPVVAAPKSSVGLTTVSPRRLFVHWTAAEDPDGELVLRLSGGRSEWVARDEASVRTIRLDEAHGRQFIDLDLSSPEVQDWIARASGRPLAVWCELGTLSSETFSALAWSPAVELPVNREALAYRNDRAHVRPASGPWRPRAIEVEAPENHAERMQTTGRDASLNRRPQRSSSTSPAVVGETDENPDALDAAAAQERNEPLLASPALLSSGSLTTWGSDLGRSDETPSSSASDRSTRGYLVSS